MRPVSRGSRPGSRGQWSAGALSVEPPRPGDLQAYAAQAAERCVTGARDRPIPLSQEAAVDHGALPLLCRLLTAGGDDFVQVSAASCIGACIARADTTQNRVFDTRMERRT